MTMQVNVSNNGTTTIKYITDIVDAPMPAAKRTRDAAAAKYKFNDLELGKGFFVENKQAAAAAAQAFKSAMYAPAQAKGRLSMRDMDRYPDMKRMYGLADGSYGLWLVAHKEKVGGEKA